MQRKWQRRWRRLNNAIIATVAAASIMLASAGAGLANPGGGQITTGAGTIVQIGNMTTITQTTDKLGINWQSYNIGAGETVRYIQPNASSVALNRVVGNNPSAIYGSLLANGKVYLINPNGILFAPGAQVNVGGLVASTLNISEENFRNGNYIFTKDGSAGSVVNQGTITATDHVVLLGPEVKNEGIIAARVSALAAGNKVSLDFYGDKLLNVTVNTGAAGGRAVNSGTLLADGGLVIMSAGTKDALLGSVVMNSGVIRAQSMSNVNGVIRLEAGTVTNSGTLDASGKAAGQTGGTVKMLGDHVTLAQGSVVDVSGDAGGGTALIGGNFQGKGPEYNAVTTIVENGVTVNADAITQGNGGKVAVWANGRTEFYGQISARGGANSGDGGYVEVSGKEKLVYQGSTDTRAPKGAFGTLLLDPYRFVIAPSGGDRTGAQIGYDLSMSNVVIKSSDGSLMTGWLALLYGDDNSIVLADVISWMSPTTLTLVGSGRTIFQNFYGPNALQPTGGGRWLIYLQDPHTNWSGLVPNFEQYRTAYGGSVTGTGNGFIYTTPDPIPVRAAIITATNTRASDSTARSVISSPVSVSSRTTAAASSGGTVVLPGDTGTAIATDASGNVHIVSGGSGGSDLDLNNLDLQGTYRDYSRSIGTLVNISKQNDGSDSNILNSLRQ